MKTMHLNKVIAIAQVKLKAFMGKNCIIMPLFSIGFTLLMKYLYSSMSTGASSPEYLNAYVLGMGLVMNLGMCGIYCPSLLLAEEKEKNTLRVLMTSSVNSVEFFAGSVLPVFFITVLINFLLIPISGFAMDGGQLGLFALVSVIASLTSCIIGMILGIFAKNQVSAGTITTPVLLLLVMVPIFGDVVEALSGLSEYVFTGIVMDMIMTMGDGAKKVLDSGSIVVMACEVILAVLLFLFFYKRNGFERD